MLTDRTHRDVAVRCLFDPELFVRAAVTFETHVYCDSRSDPVAGDAQGPPREGGCRQTQSIDKEKTDRQSAVLSGGSVPDGGRFDGIPRTSRAFWTNSPRLDSGQSGN